MVNETPDIPVGSPQGAPPVAQPTNLLAVFGLVAGILGLLASPWPFVSFVAILLSGVGLALSIMGKKRAAEGAGGAGVATGGLVVSIIGLLLSLVFSACYVACGMAAQKASKDIETELNKSAAQWEQFGREMEKAGKDWEKAGEEFRKRMEEAAREAERNMPGAIPVQADMDEPSSDEESAADGQ